jgi:hypothetical protein
LKRPAPGGGRRGGYAGLEEFPAVKVFSAHDYPRSKKIAVSPFLLFYLEIKIDQYAGDNLEGKTPFQRAPGSQG